MRRLKSILAATDFSPDSREAVKRAALIAAATGDISRAVAFHVLRSSWLDQLKHFVALPGDLARSVESDALRSLEESVMSAQIQSGLALEPKLCVGNVVEAVLDAAAGFDLLIVGARGNQSARKSTVAATVERLMRQIEIPVLVVRGRAENAYRRVLVAVDFSKHALKAWLYAWAIAPGAEIHLAHVFETPFETEMLSMGVPRGSLLEAHEKARSEAETEMRGFMEQSGVDAQDLHFSIEHGSHIPGTLRDKAMEMSADLVVVGKHGRSLIERLLMGSVTLQLLADCPCDLLVSQ
ncbi:MAG: universal stress protein [Syntrophobacteraceae bacterium]|jgi:nucleotide-binding universal stress UspA family protein|nr:universal stress protein [Syntrophobacteraceae bacterium]